MGTVTLMVGYFLAGMAIQAQYVKDAGKPMWGGKLLLKYLLVVAFIIFLSAFIQRMIEVNL